IAWEITGIGITAEALEEAVKNQGGVSPEDLDKLDQGLAELQKAVRLLTHGRGPVAESRPADAQHPDHALLLAADLDRMLADGDVAAEQLFAELGALAPELNGETLETLGERIRAFEFDEARAALQRLTRGLSANTANPRGES
ncbi:MAG: hypothetical protein ACOCVM_00425, partial [Desulfovibrionaceae bacterium]